jgi:hypothetical protein
VAQQGQETADLSFFVGRKPTRNDIALGRDIARASTSSIKDLVRRWLDKSNNDPSVLIIDDNAGAGKTTILMRSIFDLAEEGYHVFEYQSLSTPNLDLCASVFNAFKGRAVIICDNFADHAAAFLNYTRDCVKMDF